MLLGNWKLFETVPKSFLPPEDKGTVFCDIQLAPGATLGRTEQAMRSAEQKLMSIPGVRQVSSTSGFSFMGGNGENLGMCIAQLDSWDKRKTPELSLDSIMQKASILCDEIPAAKAPAWYTGPIGERQSMISARPPKAPTGRPPPMTFPMQVRSGVMP